MALMTLGTREDRRQAFAGWIAQLGGTCHLTAVLGMNASRAQVEDRCCEWVKWTNRHYLGRDWYTERSRAHRMSGLAFFEHGAGGWHAHLIVRPPREITVLQFTEEAPTWFSPPVDPLKRAMRGKTVTRVGKMHAQIIGPTAADAFRVARYDTKQWQFQDDTDATGWKFLDDLISNKGSR